MRRPTSVYEIECECGKHIDAPHNADAKVQTVICSQCKRKLVIKWTAVYREKPKEKTAA